MVDIALSKRRVVTTKTKKNHLFLKKFLHQSQSATNKPVSEKAKIAPL